VSPHAEESQTLATVEVSNETTGMQAAKTLHTGSLNWYKGQGKIGRGNESELSIKLRNTVKGRNQAESRPSQKAREQVSKLP
jgi:hypothetical protein